MTQEEFQLFIEQENIVLESTNARFSFKTNLLLIKRNFDKIRIRLGLLHQYITYIFNLIDVETITQNVLENIATNKQSVAVNYDLLVDTSVIQGNFKISRFVNNLVIIEKQLNPENWNVTKLNVFVKTVDGQLVYPTIFTRNNKIELYFLDGITSNYTIFFI